MGSLCTADAISFDKKAAHRSQDPTVIMYRIKMMSWCLCQQSLQFHWSHNGHIRFSWARLHEQGAHRLVSDLYFGWILSAFYSFLKTTYKARFTSAYKTPDTHEHLLHLRVRKRDSFSLTCNQIPGSDCCFTTLVARLPLSATESELYLVIYVIFTGLEKCTVEMQWLFLSL